MIFCELRGPFPQLPGHSKRLRVSGCRAILFRSDPILSNHVISQGDRKVLHKLTATWSGQALKATAAHDPNNSRETAAHSR